MKNYGSKKKKRRAEFLKRQAKREQEKLIEKQLSEAKGIGEAAKILGVPLK